MRTRTLLLLSACSAIGCRLLIPGETYVLPAGYRGSVVVFWEHPLGVPLEHDRDGNPVIHVGSDGIARISQPRPSAPLGWVTPAYLYRDEQGGTRAIGASPRKDGLRVFDQQIIVLAPEDSELTVFAFSIGRGGRAGSTHLEQDRLIRLALQEDRRKQPRSGKGLSETD
jgi:hypothetical protein